MKGLNTFLESSTIHGLTYISIKNKRFDRIFWMLVIMMGFTGAGILIYRSFESWNESPVKTTIETHPIAEITFPKVTVCPPKNTNTDLNYDLMMTKNKTLNDDIRHEMEKYALDMLYDHIYDTVLESVSTNAIYIIPVSMTLQRAATMQARTRALAPERETERRLIH